MKIGIDVRSLSGGNRSGVEEYILNLLPKVFELDKKNKYILFFNSFKKSQTDFSWIKKYPNVFIKTSRFPNKLLNFLLWYFSWPKIDKLLGGVDLFFMPNISFAALSSKTKLVLTVHDLSFERYSEFFSNKRRLWHFFINPKKLIKKANQIIAISESTKEDLEFLYKIETSKIKVIHSGISQKLKIIDRNDSQLIKIKEKYKLPFKFILYLGTQEPRKNINSLVIAFDELKKEAQKNDHKELQKFKLVLAGNPGWLGEKIEKTIKNSKFKNDIIKTGFIQDEDKVYLYNLASAMVYPSYFEGFGFPPVEAQACGLPVITSLNSSFFEVVGNSVILIDQDRSEEIKEAIKKIVLNKNIKNDLIKKGLENCQKFSWEKSAKNFLKLIASL